jgi:GMP synthase (glutamine-hydrolysing)
VERWAVVQHVAFEGPGLIGHVLAEQSQAVAVHRMDLGHPLPDLQELAGLVVLSGPMGALGDHE